MVSLKEILDDDTVGELPIREVITVEPETIVRAAVARMRAMNLGCAVILDPKRVPVGIFTERSLLKVLARNVSLDECPVSEFADFRCTVVKSSDPASYVWEAIEQNGDRFICVTDDNGRLIGMTGQRGLAEHVSACFPGEVAVQRIGGTPWMQHREGA